MSGRDRPFAAKGAAAGEPRAARDRTRRASESTSGRWIAALRPCASRVAQAERMLMVWLSAVAAGCRPPPESAVQPPSREFEASFENLGELAAWQLLREPHHSVCLIHVPHRAIC